jgi:hypothetical protein
MNTETTRPTTLHDQLLALGAQAGRMRAELDASKLKLPKSTLENLRDMQTSLGQLGNTIERFQKEHSNMLALRMWGRWSTHRSSWTKCCAS